MPLFRRKETTLIDAEWFTDPNNPPRGVQPHPGGGFFVMTKYGYQTPVMLGDWIAKEDWGGGYYPIKDHVMRTNFEEFKTQLCP